jgi:DNA-binding response OmpR family regulator
MCKARLIVVMGSDATLLESRARVLEGAGFAVRRAQSIPQVKHALQETNVDLLLLCHTLTKEDCQRAIAASRELNPKIATLSLVAYAGRRPKERDRVVIHQMSGPRMLVETVRSILN